MYSLYKAWLAGDHRQQTHHRHYRQVVVTAGVGPDSRRFTAHREVLAEHSGYLKSLLDGCPGDEVAVPNVAPEVFGPLLAFMYTGHLDLDGENVYAMLLAGHLLHVPRAVDLCRGFLLRRQCSGLLVKPIPSRKYPPCGAGLYWPPPPVVAPIVPPPFRPHSYPPPSVPPPPPHPLPTDPVASTSTADPPPPVAKRSERRTVTDVACCDGPVRFRRVLNVNYGATVTGEKRPVFVCHYCKHTFKSHYCYRKHARRHINPVGAPDEEDRSAALRLNVQYYPCKTCGSKFPSYYFVHKHRKLCHPDETAHTNSALTTTASAPS
ncbi:hypothetical protein AAG570_012729 [Ranatra chinensis]|uniref:Uncharacterized protein n=1 Tax=Ranatra chinensis TaxID=642074 RepID=A0ABD0YEP3_9HEMI